MSLNTAHANNGVLIHSGEYILLFSDSVSVEFIGQDSPVFKGSKQGRIYLTSHRMIFNAKNQSETLQSFSFPFVALNDVELEQPVFGANYIKGKVRSQPNGNWTGEVKFKLHFKAGGAIDFGQALLRAATTAQRNKQADSPPPYTPPTGSWYEAPQPAYQAPPGYYGWLPQNEAFTTGPPPNTVYMSDNPPPYPGIGTPQSGGAPGYNGYPGGFAQPQPAYPGAPPQHGYPGAPPQHGYPGAPPQQGYPGAPPQHGYPGAPPQQGYPGALPQQGYPGGPPQHGYSGVPSPQHGYPGAIPQGYPALNPQEGYPGTVPQGYPATSPQGGYPGATNPDVNPSAPPQAGFAGYPSGPQSNSGPSQSAAGGYPSNSTSGSMMGFTAGPANSKEEEANQGGYYDARQRQVQQNHGGFAPPPSFYAPPPSYSSLNQNQKQ